MVEECGRIVAVDRHSVWVETTAASGCGRCQEAGGCGQNSIFRMLGNRGRQLQVASGELNAQVGDRAVVGVPGGALVRASVTAYLVPLLALLAGAMIGHYAGSGSDVLAIAGGIAGIAAGFGVSHFVTARFAARIGLQPVLVSVGRAGLGAEVVPDRTAA